MTETNTISASMLADLTTVTGPVTIPMTNDYLFRALLQRNNQVLTALIRALLHLRPEEVSSVEIGNPIELGNSVEEKNFILDIKLTLNSSFVINLEMQVINEGNWVDRSTCYLCRTYSNLVPGNNYSEVKPVIQIGLLNFTLFPVSPEFYATYKLLNEKNHTVYSDKLRLSVLNLTRTDLATEEDRLYEIDQWAAFFKATTWEELKMLAQNNSDIKEAVSTVYQLTQEEKIRQQCEAREDYYRTQNDIKLRHNRELAEKDREIEQRDEVISRQANEISQQTNEISRQADEIAQLRAQLEQLKQSK